MTTDTGMLDVEYLLRRPPFEGTLVYIYRSGALCGPMKAVLQGLAESMGLMFLFVDENDHLLWGSDGLYPSLPFCDWSQAKGRRRNMREHLIRTLSASESVHAVHFVPRTIDPTSDERWPSIQATCFIVEEPEITPDTLPRVLHYLEATTDLADKPDLLSQPLFAASFRTLENGTAELPDVIQEFEERVILFTDPITHRFAAQRFHPDSSTHHSQWTLLSPVSSLVKCPSNSTAAGFAMALNNRRREKGLGPRRLVKELLGSAGAMIAPKLTAMTAPSIDCRGKHRARSPDPDARTERNTLLWAALLLAWEERLAWGSNDFERAFERTADPFIVAVQHFVADFIERATRSGDCLAGRWAAIGRSLNKVVEGPEDVSSENRVRVVRHLANAVILPRQGENALWLARLSDAASSTIERIAELEDEEVL